MAEPIHFGLESQTNETGNYGDDEPYDEHLVVEIDGETQKVPVTDVRTATYDQQGVVPDVVDFDRVFVYDDLLHAETWLDDGTLVVLMPSHNTPTARHQTDDLGRYASWEVEPRLDPIREGIEEIWRRPNKSRDEIAALVDGGLSAAEAIDYWVVQMNDGYTVSSWSDTRGVSHQAVSENVRKAQKKLDERRRGEPV